MRFLNCLNQNSIQLNDKEYHETLDELVNYLDVKEKLNVQVRRLSLGERMKMEIIAALLHRPKIILLDEPTLGLDVISQSKIREFVKYHNQQYKTTFVITSHYTKDIQEMCKRVFVLNKGKKIYDGDFNKLIKNINPKRKLIYEFPNSPNDKLLLSLDKKYKFELSDKVLTAFMPEDQLQNLLTDLMSIQTPSNLIFEDLPVDETMKNLFSNPEKYL